MRLFDKHFTNELGRSIHLTVDRPKPVDGSCTLLVLGLAGPDSKSTNEITLREGRELLNALRTVIR